ncbi:hypothetical protein [Terribacillus sp. 7520-G]|uniref:hypothetical protein n=1 Tax=Terribacillus TaxID=459532 RepID=UPI000BA77220|nr:hypothetical protein [Terribacillus sp. 7520-G]PAD38626.1 hypothetical protein CHH53_10370 [Terribacillus sp. 7520-G]
MRKIYEYMSKDQKKEALIKLKAERAELQTELENKSDYPRVIKEVLLHTLDAWQLEIEELELELKENS